jgi:hypothetical protein
MTTHGDPGSSPRPDLVLVPVLRYGNPVVDADLYEFYQNLCRERAAETFARDMARGLRGIVPGPGRS